MTQEEYDLMVALLILQDSIEKVKKILEAEHRREEGKIMLALQKDIRS